MTPPHFDARVAEQAVSWLLEMQDGELEPARQQQFAHWLSGHAEHQRAWDHIQTVNQRLRGVPGKLARRAVDIPASAARRRVLKVLSLMLGVPLVGLGLRQQGLVPPLLADYRSATGERRHWKLDDDSRLNLNTASAVDVRYTADQRRIHLLEGELLLDAAHDSRPLVIHTPFAQVLMQTGRISVRLWQDRVRVAVIEGQAQLRTAATAVDIPAGRQRMADIHNVRTEAVMDPNASAWLEGMLLAAHMPLSEFLQELSRYRPGHLQCDPAVAKLLLSGSYPLADSERILDLLPTSLPVRVQRFTRYWVRVMPA